MFIKHPLRDLMMVLLVGIAITFTACSSDDAVTETKYSGPGSKWDTTFRSNGTFTLVKYPDSSSTTPDMTVNGTYTTLSSGFKKLTVTDATGTDAPSAGDLAYGLEIPGYVFVLKPLGGDQIIPMVTSGACPGTDFDANWVNVNMGDGADLVNNAVSGTFHFDFATSTATLPARYKLGSGDNGYNLVGNGTCSNGIMTIGNVEMYLTSTGGAIVNTDITDPVNNEFIFGFSQKAVSDTSSLDGTYAGLVFNDTASAGNKVFPVKIVCSSATCTGNELTDVDAGTTSANGVTLTLSTADSPATGMVYGTIQDIGGGPTGNVICMFDKNAASSGKTIGSCVGQEASDNTKLFNVLFTSI